VRRLFWAGLAVALVGGFGAGAALSRAEEGDRCISPSRAAERAVHGFGYLAGVGIILVGIAVAVPGVMGQRRSAIRLVGGAVIVAVGISQLVVAYYLVGCD
jgi:hypothetical protein